MRARIEPHFASPPKIERRSIQAAGMGGVRWNPSSMMPAPASTILASRWPVNVKASWLVMNSPHAASALNQLSTSIIGDGPSARSRHATQAKQLEEAWRKFWRRCDAEGVSSDLGHFATRAVRSWVTAGEAVVIMTTDRRTRELRLKLLNAEQLDATVNTELDGGGRITSGVEQDASGCIVAYHIRPDAPDLPHAQARDAVRLSADDVVHIFDPTFPGQPRGISPLTASATRLHELDRLEDNLQAKHATAANVGLVFTQSGGDGVFDDADGDPKFPAMEPGASLVAPPGYDVTSVQGPNPEGDVAFAKHLLRSIAIGVGLPYELISGDLADVNYSSAKLGHESFRRRVDAIRRTLLVPKFFEPVWRRFLTIEVLAGRLDIAGIFEDPDAALDCEFLFPAWASLDPEKDNNATVAAIDAGIMSRFEAIAARGRDPEEVIAEIGRLPAITKPAPSNPKENADA